MRRIEGVSARLLACARREFLEKGFAEASLRCIAEAADTSTRAIYTRFSGKEGLFSALVSPVAEEFKAILIKGHEQYFAEERSPRFDLSGFQGYLDLMGYIYDHLDEFMLIVFRSQGTEFASYLDDLVAIDHAHLDEQLRRARRAHRGLEAAGASDVLLYRLVAKSFYTSLFEPVSAGLPREDALRFTEDLHCFFETGIAGVVQKHAAAL